LTNLTGTGNVDFARFIGNAGDTAAAPSITWTGDLTTGIYRPAAAQVAITTGGVQRALFSSAGITGTLVGNASSATYASAVTLTADNTTNATRYPLFASVATGNSSPRTDTGFTYNPSTGALTTSTFIGALSGNASSATALTSNAGSNTNPIYFSSGKPTASTYSFGNASGNIPISNGTLNTSLNADLLDGIDSIYYKKGVGKGSYYKDVVNVSLHNTAYEILIKTKIPFISSAQMPLIHLEGYAYGANSPIEIRIAFYIYNGAFASYGCTSTCPWKPDIKLFTYVDGTTTYVGVALIKSIYFPQCTVNYIDVWGGGTGFQTRNYSEGWTVEFNTASSPSIVPTDNLASVPYKPIANSITGNASTATTATSADKLSTLSFGSATQPVYFSNGLPVACTAYGSASVNYAASAGTASTSTQVANNFIFKFNSGTTENNNLYTYNGSAAKTINIVQGSNITITSAANTITISAADNNTTYSTGTLSELNSGINTTGKLQTAKNLSD